MDNIIRNPMALNEDALNDNFDTEGVLVEGLNPNANPQRTPNTLPDVQQAPTNPQGRYTGSDQSDGGDR